MILLPLHSHWSYNGDVELRGRQVVRMFGVQDRRGDTRINQPWVVRWEVDGRRVSRSFRTKALADRDRSKVIGAYDRGERFDRATG